MNDTDETQDQPLASSLVGTNVVELIERSAPDLVVNAIVGAIEASRRRDDRRAARVRSELPYGAAFLVLTNQRLIGYSLRRWSEGPGRLVAEWPIASVQELAATQQGLLVSAGGVRYSLSCDKHRGRDQISSAFGLS